MKNYERMFLKIEKAEDVILTSGGFETEDDDFGEGSGSGTDTPIIPSSSSIVHLYNI